MINLALIGLGGYASVYVNYALDRLDERVNIVGVADIRPESCKRLDEFKSRGIPVYTSDAELFKEKKVDLAVICTPIHCHADNIISALENGANVLCEKPLCADIGDVDRIDAAARRANRFVYIGYQWSFSDAILSLKRDIINNRFGKCLSAKTLVLWPRSVAYFSRSWGGRIRLDNGALVYDSIANNAAAHYLHNILFLLGGDGESLSPSELTAELYRTNEIENFDTAKIDMKFENGATAHFVASHACETDEEPVFEMVFERARVYYSQLKTDITSRLMPSEYDTYDNVMAITEDGERIDYGTPFDDVNKKLICAIESTVEGTPRKYACTYRSAAVHTSAINRVQREFEISPLNDYDTVTRDQPGWGKGHTFRVARGLTERLVECYLDPQLKIKIGEKL